MRDALRRRTGAAADPHARRRPRRHGGAGVRGVAGPAVRDRRPGSHRVPLAAGAVRLRPRAVGGSDPARAAARPEMTGESRFLQDVLNEPKELRAILGRLLGPQRPALQEAARALAAAPVAWIAGMGSSWHGGFAVQAILDAAGKPA